VTSSITIIQLKNISLSSLLLSYIHDLLLKYTFHFLMYFCSASKSSCFFKTLIFKLVSILAENHIQKRSQTPRAIKSSLATSEQAGKKLW